MLFDRVAKFWRELVGMSDNLLDITIFIHQLGSGLISNPGNAWEIV